MILIAALQLIRSAEDEVHMILPKVKEAEHIMQLFGREHLTFDVGLQRTQVLCWQHLQELSWWG